MEAIRKFVVDVGSGLAKFLEREAGHACVLLFLVFWGFQLMRWHVAYGERMADQAIGALLYALNVRKPEAKP
jgi:hypothetical protein